MITKPVPALLCTPTGHSPTSRTPPELATALFVKAGAPQTLEYSSYYNIDGTLQNTKEPALGGLPSEIVEYGYNGLGQPTTLGGSTGYILDTHYTALGQVDLQTLGTANNEETKKSYLANTFEEGTGRVTRSYINAQAHPSPLQDLNYSYNQAGNVTSIADTSTLGGGAETQCFTYDGHRRLTEAWTPSSQKCSDPRSAASLSGPAPYWTSYEYNSAGQRRLETTHKATGNTNTTYCHEKATQPHALTGTSTKADCTNPDRTYSYDDTGNTTRRPGPNTTQELLWSEEGKLAKLTEDGKTTDYLYGPDGSILVRTTQGGERVLYAGTTELHLKANGTLWAQRYYGSAAVRSNATGANKLTYLAGDHHGTQSLAITADNTQTPSKRYLSPFGAERGRPTGNPWPDDKGFLGKTNDITTGLTHIGARQYDPAIGQFISVDPLLEADKHQTLNGYGYSANNPLTFSDPSGLRLACGGNFAEACPTRPDGTPGNGRPNEAVDYSKPRPYHPCNSGCGKSVEKRLLELGPQTDDRDALLRYFYAYGSGTSGAGDFWATAVGEGDRLSMACYGRAGCRAAHSYLLGHDDVDGAKRIAATYCLEHAKACASEATWEEFTAGSMRQALELVAMGVGGGSYGCKCFPGDTNVLLSDGKTKPIKDVKVGDTVLATDPKTGETGPRKVTRLIRTEDDKHFNTLSIATEDGIEKLTATHEHPFWSPSEKGWVEAGDLEPGMTLRTDDGDTVIVTGNKPFTKHAITYNLTVEGLHTYYVLAGATPVLVHNSSCPRFVADSSGNVIELPQVKSSISSQKQGRHILGGRGYKGGGYFNSQEDAQAVLDAYHSGAVQVMGITKTGNIQIRVPSVVGYDNNPAMNRFGVPTNIFMIKGTKSPSVVPMNPQAGAP